MSHSPLLTFQNPESIDLDLTPHCLLTLTTKGPEYEAIVQHIIPSRSGQSPVLPYQMPYRAISSMDSTVSDANHVDTNY